MNTGKALKTAAGLSVIVLIGYFYSLEFRQNWASLQNFRLTLDMPFLIISLLFYLLSYLLETYVWQVCINGHLGRNELNFSKSIAVVNSSGLFKYLPGRIWTYTAQLLWLKKYGVSKSVILYVNLICILASIIVSLYLGLLYLAFYADLVSTGMIILLALALILFNIVYAAWNPWLMNKLIAAISRFLKKEIQPLNESKRLILFSQFIYLCSWSLMGLGGYFLAEGIGLSIPVSSMLAVLASMSLSWMVGYLVVVSPGGLGVREGMMLLMLNGVVNTQAALIFPILSRLMYLISEALLGLAAFLLGIRHNIFSTKKTSGI